MTNDHSETELYAAIASRLNPVPPSDVGASATRRSLLDRVRQSAIAHQEYLTVRREDGEWQQTAPGQQTRLLRSDAHFGVEVVQLRPGSELTWPLGVVAQEILVLDGALVGESGKDPGPDPDAQQVTHGQHAFHVRHLGQAGLLLRAVGDTTLYVRNLRVDPQALPVLEARWWQLACSGSGWVDPMRRPWVSTQDGVKVLPLQGDTEVVSMLVRFSPGASVPDHGHALNEDCLVLEGEMFLGDILLRPGDYQLAPGGGSHFNENSDVGVLFYFHGALDPVLRSLRLSPLPG